jgi:hypothetical protein
MSKKKLAASALFLSIFATNVMANECPKNFQEVTVTGAVNTQNVTADMQVGTIDMQLTSVKKDKLLFDQLGAVVGQITDQGFDPEIGLPFAYLDHDITFADNVEIDTNGDLATIYGDPTTGSPVYVEEVISNFQGTKTFNKATGTIIATGQLNSNVEYNSNTGEYISYNSFVLSGSLCIKD